MRPASRGRRRAQRHAALLPAPQVAFAADFPRRLQRLVARLALLRERREGAGRAALAGGGEEFVGYRPYRSGEDLRQLDWSLYARLDRPYVRVTRRESSESWAICIDGSASMGVGRPGKLQAACEVGAGLAAVGLRNGAQVRVSVSGPEDEGAAEFHARRPSDLFALLSFLEAREARGAAGLEELCTTRPPAAQVGRVFVVGDFFDLSSATLAGLMRRGRELFALQVLAPLELAPGAADGTGGGVEWVDPEGEASVRVQLDPAACARYERDLERFLERWRSLAAQHRFLWSVGSSADAFEDLVRGLIGRV